MSSASPSTDGPPPAEASPLSSTPAAANVEDSGQATAAVSSDTQAADHGGDVAATQTACLEVDAPRPTPSPRISIDDVDGGTAISPRISIVDTDSGGVPVLLSLTRSLTLCVSIPVCEFACALRFCGIRTAR